jgi:hypothetical protein
LPGWYGAAVVTIATRHADSGLASGRNGTSA